MRACVTVIWIERRSWPPYIVGVFAEPAEAEKEQRRLISVGVSDLVVHSSQLNFPVFFTQDERGFLIHDEQTAFRDLQARSNPRKDDEWCYTNLYRLIEPFYPRQDGRDQMGLLEHWHIENYHMLIIDENGLSALWHRRHG